MLMCVCTSFLRTHGAGVSFVNLESGGTRCPDSMHIVFVEKSPRTDFIGFCYRSRFQEVSVCFLTAFSRSWSENRGISGTHKSELETQHLRAKSHTLKFPNNKIKVVVPTGREHHKPIWEREKPNEGNISETELEETFGGTVARFSEAESEQPTRNIHSEAKSEEAFWCPGGRDIRKPMRNNKSESFAVHMRQPNRKGKSRAQSGKPLATQPEIQWYLHGTRCTTCSRHLFYLHMFFNPTDSL